jgi:two-component system, NarL family, response regulator DevR
MTSLTAEIQILLVDDHSVVRAGIRSLLAGAEDITVVGEADCVGEAISLIHRVTPDIVLLDVRLPDGSGFEVIRSIRNSPLNTKFIILSAFNDDEIIAEAIKCGVEGYLLKELDGATLSKSIRTVAAGDSILDPGITRRVIGQFKTMAQAESKSGLEMLSPQEHRVIELVSEGKTNKEIGVNMGLSDKTVKNYLSNLMEKLNLSRRSEAAAYYARHSRDKS